MASGVTVARWTRRLRDTGSVSPAQMGGYEQNVLERERDWLLARVSEEPDVRLLRLHEEFAFS